jgi:hypothetical protein
MYARLDTIPQSLAPAKQARNATYRADTLTDWIAEVDVLPAGASEITAEQYVTLLGEIEDYNKNLPEPTPPPEPEPQPDPFALIADKLDDLSAEIRKAGRSVEADKMHEVAEIARAASGHR